MGNRDWSDKKAAHITQFNDIGINSELDWKRIKKLLTIGLIASFIVLIGDALLGFGVEDESLSGLERMLSAYDGISDARIFWSAMLGFIGIPLEGLCYFGIYRLMAGKSPKHAHAYRSGIFGYLIFGGCGVHVYRAKQIHHQRARCRADE